jgi:hypothetical protein
VAKTTAKAGCGPLFLRPGAAQNAVDVFPKSRIRNDLDGYLSYSEFLSPLLTSWLSHRASIADGLSLLQG